MTNEKFIAEITLLTLMPRVFQAIKSPRSGTAQSPVKTREMMTGGRGSGSRKVCDFSGLASN